MHQLLKQQLQRHFGEGFRPDHIWLDFLETVSDHYSLVEQQGSGSAVLQQQSRLELANQHAMLRRIIDSIPDLIYFKSPQNVYLGCNRAFEEYFGIPENEITGKTDADFLDEEAAVQLHTMQQEMLAANGAHAGEVWVTYPDGRKACLETVKTPYAVDGMPAGLIGIGRDITERKRLEEALQLAAYAYDNCSESMMVTDAGNSIMAVNPAFSKITGYAAEEVLGKNPSILKSGLQDGAFYRRMWQELETTGRWQGELWNRRKNGEIFPEWLKISRVYDGDGKVQRHVALFSDITGQKRTEEKLRQEKQFSDDLINTLPDFFYVLDEHGGLVRVNRKFLEVSGHAEEDLPLPTILDLFATEERERFTERLHDAFITGCLDAEATLIACGRSIPCHFTGHRTRIDGKFYLVGLGRDISEHKAYEQMLLHQANVDVLTGLASRRHFMDMVDQELARVRRYGGPTSVIMLDLDEFKAINDRNGHQVGDMVLQITGDICRKTLRETDIAGRVGGEEFAILLPETCPQQALEVAERLRQNIAKVEVSAGQGVLRFTASIGVDTLSGNAEADTSALLGKADRALYIAKSAGRNRVCAGWADGESAQCLQASGS